MIYLDNPYIETGEKSSRLICDVLINNSIERKVWFEVENKYAEYLCSERCDAYVVGLLNYAMRLGHNIKSVAPITESLLYNINEYLMPALLRNDKRLKRIKIEAPVEVLPLKNAGAVGTGLSCGVDSFFEILKHTTSDYKSRQLTHLCINNVGAFNNIYKDYGLEKIKDDRYDAARKVALELGLPLVETNSNFMESFKQNHLLSHTYSSMFAVLCLQKLWGIYYYGSAGQGFESFSLEDNSLYDCGKYELLTLMAVSKENQLFYSGGGGFYVKIKSILLQILKLLKGIYMFVLNRIPIVEYVQNVGVLFCLCILLVN